MLIKYSDLILNTILMIFNNEIKKILLHSNLLKFFEKKNALRMVMFLLNIFYVFVIKI